MADLSAPSNIPESGLDVDRFVNTVRMYMRDYPELNRLISGTEHSNRQIAWAILDALDDWNSTPPLISRVGLSTHPSSRLLLRATAIALLESVGILQTRNNLTFSDGGIQVGTSDKTPFIMNWLQLLKQDYEDKKLKMKIAINIEQGWDGGVSSEFAYLSAIYVDW